MTVNARISDAPFDPEGELARFRAGLGAELNNAGALASFTGLMRDEGGQALRLELQHFPGFTESEIERFAANAARRFGLLAVLIVHRVGVMQPGDAIVLVAAAAAHRRAAFEGCDCLMDYLKSAAPLWKREHRPDGAVWIEPTAQDHADRARWQAG